MEKITKGEVVGIGITVLRYGLAELMARRIKADKPIGLAMTAFIAADILDGAILRKFNLDTPKRRIADGVVDHLSQIRVASEVAKKHPASRPYIGILAARALLVGGLNAIHLAKTGEATKGRLNQEATNLASAGFAIAATHGNVEMTNLAGTIASGVALVTAPAHFKGIGKKHTGGIRKL